MSERTYQVEIHTEETTYHRHRITIRAKTAQEAGQLAVQLVDNGQADDPGTWLYSEHGASEAFEVVEVTP